MHHLMVLMLLFIHKISLRDVRGEKLCSGY